MTADDTNSPPKTGVTLTVVEATEITYTLKVTNTGDADATGVTLVDTLPAGLKIISISDDGKFNESDSTIKWDLGTVAGNIGTVSVSVTVQTTN